MAEMEQAIRDALSRLQSQGEATLAQALQDAWVELVEVTGECVMVLREAYCPEASAGLEKVLTGLTG